MYNVTKRLMSHKGPFKYDVSHQGGGGGGVSPFIIFLDNGGRGGLGIFRFFLTWGEGGFGIF